MNNVESTCAHKFCEGPWVTDGIKEDYKYWYAGHAVLLSAPTGMGKTTFIIDTLIPYAQSQGKLVIIVSNRIALNVQYKKDVLSALRLSGTSSSVSDLRKRTQFGENVQIWSYQSITREILEWLTKGRSGYIIMDECHYFLSDSIFNANTGPQFSFLASFKRGFVRVYMSATPDHILSTVLDKETSNREHMGNHMGVPYTMTADILHSKENKELNITGTNIMTLYDFPRNYENYNITFFEKHDFMENRIAHATREDKWLCFVASKNRGEEYREKGGKQAHFLDAGQARESGVWDKLHEGKIKDNVLVTTSVIDNGVSISDENLHNIVLDFFNPTEYIQMAGRKRRKEDEEVNLFFYVPTISEIVMRRQSIGRLLEKIQDYKRGPADFHLRNWATLTDDVRNMFYIDYNANLYGALSQIVLNQLAETELINQWQWLDSLLGEMENSPNKQDAFASEILKIFGKSSTAVHWISEDHDNQQKGKIEELLRSYNNYVEADDKDDFYNEFIKIAKEVVRKKEIVKNNDKARLATINKHLDSLELPYEGINKDKCWIFKKKEI